MNALTQFQNFGPVASVFAGQTFEDDLAAGVVSGYGVIGYRGKVWRIKYRGEERDLMRDDGDGPRSSIELVIVKAANVVSKVFYEAGYVDGSNSSPDCSSMNGLTPDPDSPKKQCATCAACPKNAWGSRITEAGKQAKACVDSKRLAVVPLGDLENATFGGPMLLRVPAASLGDMATFGKTLAQLNYPVCSVGTRIAFDVKEAFPKFVFTAIRPLTEDEGRRVMELRADPQVERILSEEQHDAPAAQPPAPTAQSVFEQPPVAAAAPQTIAAAPQTVAAQPAVTQPVQQAAPKTATPIVAQPAPVTQSASAVAATAPSATVSAPTVAAEAAVTQQVAADPATGAGSFDEDLEAEMARLMGGR